MSKVLSFCELDMCVYATCAVRTRWSCKDHRGNISKYIIVDKSGQKNCLVKIDGGLLSGDQLKCDFLFVHCLPKSGYLIELKGSDLDHAAKQILNSIEILNHYLKHFKSLNARVVLSKAKTLDMRSTATTRLHQKMKSLNGTFEYKSRVFEEKITKDT